VIENGGIEPYFAEEELLMYCDQNNWIHDMQVA
jgi:hypothetical protein